MDPGDSGSDNGGEKRRTIPADLPTSLDDRRHAAGEFTMPETEMYDGWQGALRRGLCCVAKRTKAPFIANT